MYVNTEGSEGFGQLHLMFAGLKAGATPFRTRRQLSSVNPVTRSG